MPSYLWVLGIFKMKPTATDSPTSGSEFPAMPSLFSNQTLKCIKFMPSSGQVRCSLLDQKIFAQRSSPEEVQGFLGPFPAAFSRPSGQIRPTTVTGPVRTGFESPDSLFQCLCWSKDFKLLAVYPGLLLGRLKTTFSDVLKAKAVYSVR